MVKCLHIIPIRPSLLIMNMDKSVFRFGQQPKVGWGIVQSITTDMVDMFIWCQFSIKKFLHNKAMFRFIKAFTDHNIAISVLDINANKDLVANRLPVSSVKGVVVGAKSLSQSFIPAIWNGAYRIDVSSGSFKDIGVSMFPPPIVMFAAHSPACNNGIFTTVNDTHDLPPLLSFLYYIWNIKEKQEEKGDLNG